MKGNRENIFDLAEQLSEVVAKVEQNLDEGTEDDQEELAKLLEFASGKLETKLDGYAAYLAYCESKMLVISKEEERLAGLYNFWEGKFNRLKKSLTYFMQSRGYENLETDLHRFHFQKNGGKLPIILDENIAPEDFATQYPELVRIIPSTMRFDLAAIYHHLRDGKPLEFARLGEQGKTLRIK